MGADVLVADVGGTNTRLALAGPDGVPRAAARLANDDFAGFDAALAQYRAAHPGPVAACCIAIAGPVTPERARLTNRGWSFERRALSATLGGVPVQFVNDLAALGHSLPGLGPGQVETLYPGRPELPHNGQAMVAGLGTGFNVCLSKATPQGHVVVEAELGHAALPASVMAALQERVGTQAKEFASVEHLFAGRGFARLHRVLTGQEASAQQIVAGAPGTVDCAAHLLGLFARELVFAYMPLDGIRFSGSVARGILAGGRATFLAAAAQQTGAFPELVTRVPLGMIVDDSAALVGLARLGRTLIA